jgi:hypothetical protein
MIMASLNNKYTYPLTAFQDKAVNDMRLREEVKAVSGITTQLVFISRDPDQRAAVVFIFQKELSAGEKTLLDGVVAAHRGDQNHLPTLKKVRYQQIDFKTKSLIAKGFLFAGKVHSLSDNAQKTLLGLDQLRNDSMMTYPVKVNALNDADGSAVLADANDVHAFFLTAIGTVRTHWDSGTVLKDAVRDATTVDAVKAIADNR